MFKKCITTSGLWCFESLKCTLNYSMKLNQFFQVDQLILLIFHNVKHNIKKLLLLSVHNISRALNAP